MDTFLPKAIYITWNHDHEGAIFFNVYQIDEIEETETKIASNVNEKDVAGNYFFVAPYEKAGKYHFEVEAHDPARQITSERAKSAVFIWGPFLAPPTNLALTQLNV